MARKVLLGITGRYLAHLEDVLYPRGTSPHDYLSHYAREFSAVELSESDLQSLGPQGIKRCVEVTPPDFRFSIKQHLELEHSWERTVAAMRDLIKPMVQGGRLGAIVAELPSWFQYSQSSRKQLATLCECLKDLPLAIEFNRSDWYRKRVVDRLRTRGVAMVSVQTDLPGAAAMPAHAQVTAPFAYFRFMGRHIRYNLHRVNMYYEDCRYTPEKLAPWADRIASIAKWAHAYVFFQHHQDASDLYSARLFRRLVGHVD
jgi:uncharacterized protein YecE (DUF72 family)